MAYPYINKNALDIIKRNPQVNWLVDSGAFTAWKASKPIKLDDYCRFIESLPFEPFRYFALDVIGNPEQTFNNYQVMLRRGFKPVPVFTRGDDTSVLDHYYETSDLVAIGGLVGTYKNKGYVKHIMKHIGERKVHLLGFADLDYLKVYKPYSCDSSSLEGGARYGQLSLFCEKTGKFYGTKKTDFQNPPSKKISDLIWSYGTSPRTLSKSESWNGGESISRALNFRSYIRASLCLNRKLGTNYFLALAQSQAVDILIREYEKETA